MQAPRAASSVNSIADSTSPNICFARTRVACTWSKSLHDRRVGAGTTSKPVRSRLRIDAHTHPHLHAKNATCTLAGLRGTWMASF